jgi:hypothetical protein
MPTQIEQGRIHFNLDGGRKRDREQWELTVENPLCQIILQNHLKHEIGYQSLQ